MFCKLSSLHAMSLVPADGGTFLTCFSWARPSPTLCPLVSLTARCFMKYYCRFVGLLVYWERAAYCNSEPKKDDWLSINVLEMSKEMQRFRFKHGVRNGSMWIAATSFHMWMFGNIQANDVPNNFGSDFSDHKSVGYCTLNAIERHCFFHGSHGKPPDCEVGACGWWRLRLLAALGQTFFWFAPGWWDKRKRLHTQ